MRVMATFDSPADLRGHRSAHARRDDEKLRLHYAVARELLRDPERVLAIAKDNLRRWLSRDADAPCYEEWNEILRASSVEEVVALITADTEDARRLRQSTPFVGVVPREERDTILNAR